MYSEDTEQCVGDVLKAWWNRRMQSGRQREKLKRVRDVVCTAYFLADFISLPCMIVRSLSSFVNSLCMGIPIPLSAVSFVFLDHGEFICRATEICPF